MFNQSPGVGKYTLSDESSPVSHGQAITIPKAMRPVSRPITAQDIKLPGNHYFPKKEKIPGYYPIAMTRPICKFYLEIFLILFDSLS